MLCCFFGGLATGFFGDFSGLAIDFFGDITSSGFGFNSIFSTSP
jgi:hypothetical protein